MLMVHILPVALLIVFMAFAMILVNLKLR
jgi:hypothetical protein